MVDRKVAKRGRPSSKSVAAQMRIANFAKRAYRKKYGRKPRQYKKVNNSKRISSLFKYSNLEKKIIPYEKHMSVAGAGANNQKLAPISLKNCGTGSNTDHLISCCVIQTGENLTQPNLAFNTSNGPICTAVGGFRPLSSNSVSQSLPQNTFPSNRMIDGQYVNFIKSNLQVRIYMNNEMTFLNANTGDEIDLAHQVARQNLPTTFRVLLVKAKRGQMVAENVKSPHFDSIPDLASNLFIDDVGNEVGLNSLGGVQEKFRRKINYKKWYCLREMYFNLCNVSGIVKAMGTTSAGALNQLTNQLPRHPTQITFNAGIPVPRGKTKIDFDVNDVVDDHPKGVISNYNYVAHLVIMACKPGDAFAANDWSVETSGQTTLVDL